MYWLLPGKEDKWSIMDRYFRSSRLQKRHSLQQVLKLSLLEFSSATIRDLSAR